MKTSNKIILATLVLGLLGIYIACYAEKKKTIEMFMGIKKTKLKPFSFLKINAPIIIDCEIVEASNYSISDTENWKIENDTLIIDKATRSGYKSKITIPKLPKIILNGQDIDLDIIGKFEGGDLQLTGKSTGYINLHNCNLENFTSDLKVPKTLNYYSSMYVPEKVYYNFQNSQIINAKINLINSTMIIYDGSTIASPNLITNESSEIQIHGKPAKDTSFVSLLKR